MPRRKTKSDDSPKSDTPEIIAETVCKVCGDKASDHVHYGSIVCYSCRAFFRRIAVKGSEPTVCNNIGTEVNHCPMNKKMRHLCPLCRFQKCLQVGMKTSWVMTKEDKTEMREKAAIKRLTGIASDVLPPTPYEERRRYFILIFKKCNFWLAHCITVQFIIYDLHGANRFLWLMRFISPVFAPLKIKVLETSPS